MCEERQTIKQATQPQISRVQRHLIRVGNLYSSGIIYAVISINRYLDVNAESARRGRDLAIRSILFLFVVHL